MRDLSFGLDGPNLNSSSAEHTYKREKICVTILGDLAGGVVNGEMMSPSSYFNRLCAAVEKRDDIATVLIEAVGPFYAVIREGPEVRVYSSCSSPGLCFVEVGGTYQFSNTEKTIYSQFGVQHELDEDELVSHIAAHHILMRTPFRTLFRNIGRCPAGGYVCFRRGLQIGHGLYLLDQFVHRGTQSELPISDDEYGKRLEGVLKLLVDYYGIDEGTLYLSGGLDSAVLLAALNRNSQVLPCTHKLYAHRAKRESEIAESISKAQNASLKLITATDQEINISKIREAGSKGLGVIVTLEGMLAESGTKDIDSQESASTYAITGQNADTLYHVDTFAPPSRVYGVRRLLALRRTMKYRAVYSRLFLSGSFLRRILQFWPIRLPVKSRNGETRLLVESITQPAAEHVIPFAANDEDRFTTNEARKLFLAMRQARITDEVFSMSSKKGLGLDQGRKLSAIQLTLIIKLARWCRTVFNVPISYHNSLQVFNTDRLLPYQEGPLAQFFLERPLHLREVFFIKHLSEQYFKKRVGLSYRKFVLPINYSPWSDLLNFLTHAWQRLQKRVLQSRTREKDWIKGVGVQRDNIAGTEVRNSLRAILGNENRILMQYVRHPEYANYIDRLYDKLYSAESTFDIKDRSMVMELCRLINMHLFIEANVGENSAGAKSSVDRDEIKT